MNRQIRDAFPYIVFGVALLAVLWAISFGTLPKADFTFNNGDEVKTVDPPKATGVPEGRIINAIFEGLYRNHPDGMEFDDEGNITQFPTPEADGNVPMKLVPAMAESYELSEDGKTYTFKIRKEAAWSNGEPVTAHDFVWSWRRMLHPETASRYAYQLTLYVEGAHKFNSSEVDVGDRVEVELNDRPDPEQTFPHGTMSRGVVRQIGQPPKPDLDGIKDKNKRSDKELEWKDQWVFVVEIKPEIDGEIDWQQRGELKAFSRKLTEDLAKFEFQRVPEKDAESEATSNRETTNVTDAETDAGSDFSEVEFTGEVETIRNLLFDFDSQVGIRAKDDQTLVVQLMNRTPFFLDLVAFYPLYPVNRTCIEEHGVPKWTKPENLVCNGPFKVEFRRIRDRLRLVRNPHYWNKKVVRLDIVDALAIQSETTSLNMYLNGQIEWTTNLPVSIMPELKKREDFYGSPSLICYFYRLNVNKPPLDDIHVRRALNMSIDKQLICDTVTQAGEQPARSVVPPGLPGYTPQFCNLFDIEMAKAELAKSKYAREGKRMPKIEIVYNTLERHRDIAEVIQQQWKNNLGLDVGLVNMEWQSYLDTMHMQKYSVARAGWVGDYPDPNTFLDMWITDGDNNETGWSSPAYDKLIAKAAQETDGEKRLRIMEQAEAILMDEQPIVPIYYYFRTNMVHQDVKGFYPNIQDLHPLHLLRVER